MTSLKKKIVIILFFLVIGLVGYSQIQSVSEISVNLSENAIINENEKESNYEIELEFKNPSLLTLPAGKTEFFVFYDDKVVGEGHLESFTLYPISTSFVKGTFTTNSNSGISEASSVTLISATTYVVSSSL